MKATAALKFAPIVLEELQIRAECLEDETPEDAALVRQAIGDMIKGVVPTGPAREAILEELNLLETMDLFWEHAPNRRAWIEAAARLGALDRLDPKVEYYPRPRTATVDGVKWITGHYR